MIIHMVVLVVILYTHVHLGMKSLYTSYYRPKMYNHNGTGGTCGMSGIGGIHRWYTDGLPCTTLTTSIVHVPPVNRWYISVAQVIVRV